MPVTRRCVACQRPNGPHFARCMSCGEWMGMLPEDQGGPAGVEDAERRAIRLLEGMTPQRRALLPADFLRSVQIQATGVIESPQEDAETDPGIRPVALPGAADAPSWLPSELDIDLDAASESLAGDGSVDLSDPELLPSRSRRPLPLAAEYWPAVRFEARSAPPPEDSNTVDEPLDDRTSAPGLSALDGATASELGPPPAGGGPLAEALSSGRGPFGPRDARWRIVLLPHASYRDDVERLKQHLRGVLDLDLYTGQLFLHRAIPTHLASAERGDEARTKAEALRDAGLRVAMVDRERWLEGALPRIVVRMRGDRPAAVTFWDADGAEIVVDRSRLDTLVLGELPASEGVRPSLIVDVGLIDSPASLRLRAELVDLPAELDGPPRERARKLAEWLSPDAARPLPIDDGFRRVPDSARSTRSASDQVSPAEGDFTEYSMLMDLGRRFFGV